MHPQSRRVVLEVLDRIISSSVHYWATMLCDLVAALAFLGIAIHRFSEPVLVAGGVVVLGFLSSGLLEYVLHRWVLHGPPSLARRGHAQHHGEPGVLISIPLFFMMTVALAFWGILGLLLPAGVAAWFVFGLYSGYNYYAVVHHVQHRCGNRRAPVAYLRRLEQSHQLHHHQPSVNFGVSTTIWDRMFGTFQPADEPRQEPRQDTALPTDSRNQPAYE